MAISQSHSICINAIIDPSKQQVKPESNVTHKGPERVCNPKDSKYQDMHDANGILHCIVMATLSRSGLLCLSSFSMHLQSP